MMRKWFLLLPLSFLLLSAKDFPLLEPSNSSIKAIFKTLDPSNISQYLAFYELYPDSEEGKIALKHAWQLLNQDESELNAELILPELDIQLIVSLVNRRPLDPTPELNETKLNMIENLGKNFANRKLKGYGIWDEKELLSLEPDEIDICRGLFIAEIGGDEDKRNQIRYYEASIDLMTLQILAQLPPNPSSLDKIRAINNFVFHQMRFRFPPHSLWAKDIDEYTFLPSVLDSRRGVCLGVSILYICIAQRLDLDLEAITPPGHIFVRYVDEDGEITNIETTARGINPPSDLYLGIETRKLQTRNNKEVIGLAFINEASVSWMKQEYETAVKLYERALPFLGHDFLLKELLAFNYLFTGKEEEGRKLLEEVNGHTPDFAISKDPIAEDYLAGKTDIEGIKSIFLPVDETRSSILDKQKKLEEIIKKYPEFRAGLLQLAGTWLQLGREKEALPILQKYYQIDPKEAVVNYYLAVICFERMDYNQSWYYLKHAETILKDRDHESKVLISFRQVLQRACPEPSSINKKS